MLQAAKAEPRSIRTSRAELHPAALTRVEPYHASAAIVEPYPAAVTTVESRPVVAASAEPRPVAAKTEPQPAATVKTEASLAAAFKTFGHKRSQSDGSGQPHVLGPVSAAAPAGHRLLSATAVNVVAPAQHRRCRSEGHQKTAAATLEARAMERSLSEMEGAGIASPEDEEGRPILALPPGSEAWTRFETDLYLLSEGEYHPGQMAGRRRVRVPAGARGTGAAEEVAGRVSVVAPSMSSRQHYHEQLWASFAAQDWEDKELIVVESYEKSPSAFLQQKAKEDSRLVHVCFRRSSDEDFSVGLKRNMTLHLASGAVICNFDDDDMYASSYVSEMVGEMKSRGLTAITLSSWYNYIVPRRVCAYSDPVSKIADAEQLDEVLYGYGFSYVHRRREALLFPYPDVGFAEDAPFLFKLREEFGDAKVALKRDETGICMHIVHRNNSTGVAGESLSRELSQAEVDALSVARLPVFRKFLDMHATSWWQLLPFSAWGAFLLTGSGPTGGRLPRVACV